jgi:uroporphyrinogen decarboxylase
LTVLDPAQGGLGAQLACLREVVRQAAGRVPVIQTVFNPLSQAKNLCGPKALREHLERNPEALRAGLDIIARTAARFARACIDAGADGIFLAVQHAVRAFCTEAEYRQWGEPDDRAILDAAQGSWLNVLHLHGKDVHFSLAADYPVQIVNWHDRETEPSLAEGRRLSEKTVCGGWRQWETMAVGDPKRVEAEARDAIRQTGGRNLVLGTGCVTPIIAPRSCLKAASRRWQAEQGRG